MNNIKHKRISILFHVCVAILLIPLFYFKYVFTENGPELIHGAAIIKNFFSSQLYRDTFSVFPFPYSGSGIYWISAFLDLLTKPFLSEKILQIVSVLSLAYGFKALVCSRQNNNVLQFFILPFIYSAVFFSGLYGLCIATGLSLYILSRSTQTNSEFYWLHFLIYLLSPLALWNHILLIIIRRIAARQPSERISLNRRRWFLSILTLLSFFQFNISSAPSAYSFPERLKEFISLRSLVGFNLELESKTILFIGILFCISLLAIVATKANRKLIKPGIILCIPFILIILFAPDSGLGYSKLSSVLFWMLLVNLLAGMAFSSIPSFLRIALPFLFVLISFVHLYQQTDNIYARQNILIEVNLAADKMKDESLSSFYMYRNSGWDRNMLYSFSYFNNAINLNLAPKGPARLRDNVRELTRINSTAPDCMNITSFEKEAGVSVDNIAIWHYSETPANQCQVDVNFIAKRSYDKVYQSAHLSLFNKIPSFNPKDYALSSLYKSFEDIAIKDTSKCRSGSASVRLHEKNPFSPGYNAYMKDLAPYSWVEVEAYVYIESNDSKPVLVLSVENKGVSYRYDKDELANAKVNTWHKLSVRCRLPKAISAYDEIKAYVWQPGKKNVWVDDLSVKLYQKKN